MPLSKAFMLCFKGPQEKSVGAGGGETGGMDACRDEG